MIACYITGEATSHAGGPPAGGGGWRRDWGGVLSRGKLWSSLWSVVVEPSFLAALQRAQPLGLIEVDLRPLLSTRLIEPSDKKPASPVSQDEPLQQRVHLSAECDGFRRRIPPPAISSSTVRNCFPDRSYPVVVSTWIGYAVPTVIKRILKLGSIFLAASRAKLGTVRSYLRQ